MTTSDDLTKRIARILNNEGWTFEGVHEPGDYDECEDCRRVVDPIAARIAGEVTAEVRAAKVEALREAVDTILSRRRRVSGKAILEYAAECEAGDSDEHR